jgi:hypothetical protein
MSNWWATRTGSSPSDSPSDDWWQGRWSAFPSDDGASEADPHLNGSWKAWDAEKHVEFERMSGELAENQIEIQRLKAIVASCELSTRNLLYDLCTSRSETVKALQVSCGQLPPVSSSYPVPCQPLIPEPPLPLAMDLRGPQLQSPPSSSSSVCLLPQPSPPVSSSSSGYQLPQPLPPPGVPRSCRDRHRIRDMHTRGNAMIPDSFVGTVGTIETDLDAWSNHLGSTLFYTNQAKQWALSEKLLSLWKFFKVTGCRTSANRFFMVECTSCNQYVFGQYDKHKTEAHCIEIGVALLHFLFIEEPTEVHV